MEAQLAHVQRVSGDQSLALRIVAERELGFRDADRERPAAEGFDVQVLAVVKSYDDETGPSTDGEILTSEQLSTMVQMIAEAKLAEQDPTYIAPGVYSTDSIVEDNIKSGLTD